LQSNAVDLKHDGSHNPAMTEKEIVLETIRALTTVRSRRSPFELSLWLPYRKVSINSIEAKAFRTMK
jgi:hypothetical protein